MGPVDRWERAGAQRAGRLRSEIAFKGGRKGRKLRGKGVRGNHVKGVSHTERCTAQEGER